MGQYHTVAAFPDSPTDHIFTMEHYDFAAGAKLVEQAYSYEVETHHIVTPSPFMATFALMTLGPWRGARLVVIGDYAESHHDPMTWDRIFHVHEYYGCAEFNEMLTDHTDVGRGMIGEALGYSFIEEDGMRWMNIQRPPDLGQRLEHLTSRVRPDDDDVLMSDIGEYLDPASFGSPCQGLASVGLGAVWPMAYAMLAVSDGLGGGDARLEPAGRWAYSRLGFVPRSEAQRLGATNVTEWATSTDFAAHLLQDLIHP